MRVSSRANKVCLDAKLCSVSVCQHGPVLSIRKGARILASARHLNSSKAPQGTSAVQYTVTKAVRLLVANEGAPTRDKQFLVSLSHGRSPMSSTAKARARAVCDVAGVDGWFVTHEHPRGEALVLLRCGSVLK